MGVTFRWLAGGYAYGFARCACTICAGDLATRHGKVNFIDPAVWSESIAKHGDKQGRMVAQRKIIAAWKSHMKETHPERLARIPLR